MFGLKLRYSELILRLARAAAARQDWTAFHALCDRFERVMASIPTEPLVWEGDYA